MRMLNDISRKSKLKTNKKILSKYEKAGVKLYFELVVVRVVWILTRKHLADTI